MHVLMHIAGSILHIIVATVLTVWCDIFIASQSISHEVNPAMF